MKIVATSDLHGYLPEIPGCDILLIGGDVTPVWNHERKYQADWLRGPFSDWLQSLPAKNIVGVGGNHDFVLQSGYTTLGYELPWQFLDNEDVVVATTGGESVKIWGSSYSNKFGNWANMAWERELADIWRSIPRDIDILMTHGPAYGHGDLVAPRYRGHGRDSRVGSPSLTNQLAYEDWPNLKAHVFGHIHSDPGVTEAGGIKRMNVSHLDDDYKPAYEPTEFVWKNDTPTS